MQVTDRRKAVRIGWNVPAELYKDELNLSFEGITQNVSQEGAFISTKNWQCFKVDDLATIICFLPPDCTGQCETICIQGEATVCRVDQVNQGVAVEFHKSFRQFEPIHDTLQA